MSENKNESSEIETESFWIRTFFDTAESDMLTEKHIELYISNGEYVGSKIWDKELDAETTKLLVDLIF